MTTDKMASESKHSAERGFHEAQEEVSGVRLGLGKATEKGLAYQIEMKSKSCKAVHRKIVQYKSKTNMRVSYFEYHCVYTLQPKKERSYQTSCVKM